MTQAEISEKLHEFILSKLNSMPVSVLTNKEFQEFVFEINKEIFRLEQQIDLTEHATRIAEIEKKEIEQKFAATKEKFELAAEAAKVGGVGMVCHHRANDMVRPNVQTSPSRE